MAKKQNDKAESSTGSKRAKNTLSSSTSSPHSAGQSSPTRSAGSFAIRSTNGTFRAQPARVRPQSQKSRGGEGNVHVVEYRRGRAVLEVGGYRERFVAERDPLEQIVIGDYLRARQGFASDVEMAEVLGVHRTRVAAWKVGQLPDAVNTQLLAAVAVTVHALVQFLDPEVIADWLTTEAAELGGVTPVEALSQGHLAEVLQLANATEHGAYL